MNKAKYIMKKLIQQDESNTGKLRKEIEMLVKKIEEMKLQEGEMEKEI